MNVKRWALATVGAFAVLFTTGFLIYHVWLGEFYHAHTQWWRSPGKMKSMLAVMFAPQLALAALLSAVYAKGYEPNKGGIK